MYSSDDGRVVVAELLADGVHLPAEEVLALLLLRAVFDVFTNALAHLQLGEALVLEAQRELQPLDDVEGLEELSLLGVADVRGVAGGIGERPRVGDRADERLDAAVVAAEVEDLVDDGAVLALELAGDGGRGIDVRPRLGVHAEDARGVGRGDAGGGAVQRHQRNGDAAAGQPRAFDDLGDDADLAVRRDRAWARGARGCRCRRRPAA